MSAVPTMAFKDVAIHFTLVIAQLVKIANTEIGLDINGCVIKMWWCIMNG